MKKRMLVLLILTGIMAAGCGSQSGASSSAPAATAAPFELEDLTGKTVRLYDDQGKMPVTVLVFWATWCPACREEIPHVNEFNNIYSAKGVRVLSISVDREGVNLNSFAEKADIGYPVLHDGDNIVAGEYGVTGIPNVLVLDREGRVNYNGHSIDEARSIVNDLLES